MLKCRERKEAKCPRHMQRCREMVKGRESVVGKRIAKFLFQKVIKKLMSAKIIDIYLGVKGFDENKALDIFINRLCDLPLTSCNNHELFEIKVARILKGSFVDILMIHKNRSSRYPEVDKVYMAFMQIITWNGLAIGDFSKKQLFRKAFLLRLSAC
ncbi:hypothetical protein DINM_005121 [Dirofilaria immitis]|nr:hypothetical protein [Dirofilaria immitis]